MDVTLILHRFYKLHVGWFHDTGFKSKNQKTFVTHGLAVFLIGSRAFILVNIYSELFLDIVQIFVEQAIFLKGG